MKRFGSALAMLLLLLAVPAGADEPEFARDFAGAMRGCEAWVLDPSSWTEGPAPFLTAIGRGERVGAVSAIPDSFLPPPDLRRANQYWRINGDDRSGMVLTVSRELPMCHIVGAGETDLGAEIAAQLASADFVRRWEPGPQSDESGIRTTFYRFRADARFTMTVSRPHGSGATRPGIQVLMTALYEPGP